MAELKYLLAKYPIKIQADPDRAEVIFSPGFKNSAIRQRVNDLFFNDDEIHWYLRTFHPDSIITGDNCQVQRVV